MRTSISMARFEVRLHAVLVGGLHVEQFMRIEKIFEGVGSVEDLTMPPDAGENRPPAKRIQIRIGYEFDSRPSMLPRI